MIERLQGPAGWAVRQQIPKFPDKPNWEACLDSWFCHLPGQNAFWQNYVIAAIHLRPIPGCTKQPFKEFPEAEYEILVGALNPDLNPTPNEFETQMVLEPVNYARQFTTTTDDKVRRLLHNLVFEVVEGSLLAGPQLIGGPGSQHDLDWTQELELLLAKDAG